jgi:hypothetical protein
MQLSEHFTLAELTRSTTAIRKGIPNTASADVVKALTALCVNVLEPVRAHFGKPVRVTSGYRSPRLNTAIGGSASSQHCRGEAADFTVQGESNLAVCQWIMRNLKFDQLIYEFGEAGWVHCSYSLRLRHEELSAKKRGGKTVYLPGLVV